MEPSTQSISADLIRIEVFLFPYPARKPDSACYCLVKRRGQSILHEFYWDVEAQNFMEMANGEPIAGEVLGYILIPYWSDDKLW